MRALAPGRGPASVCRLVLARRATSLAVKEAVEAEAHLDLGLTVHAEFFARAIGFRLLALGADDAAYAWFGGHD